MITHVNSMNEDQLLTPNFMIENWTMTNADKVP